MKVTHNLTEAPIMKTLVKLTMPIIATNFIQTAYGLVDMIWVGRLGSGPVAAVGTAVFFINLAAAVFSMIAIGTGVKVAHSIGADREDKAKEFIHNGFMMSFLLGTIYITLILILKEQLIGFFELGNPQIEKMASQYLMISMIGTIFTFFNTLFSQVLNSMGSSGKPFKVNMIGFMLNMLLDPLFIFGAGEFSGWGVKGAAIATLTANILVTFLFIMYTRKSYMFSMPFTLNLGGMKEVLKMGVPITVQRVTFNIISIIIAKIVVQWGADAIAIQRVGIQIESISYMTIGGLQGAVAAFIGQNFGARKYDRITKGYRSALFITMIFGICTSFLFIIFPQQLFSLFLLDPNSLKLGADYLRIIGFSQLFMCMELMTVGAFNGIGKTYVPPIFSIIFTALRIPMALLLSDPFGLNGVWMAIALSSVLKGSLLVFWFKRSIRQMDETFTDKTVKYV